METSQDFVIEDDSSFESTYTGEFPNHPVGRTGTPIPRPNPNETPILNVERIRPDFSFHDISDLDSLADIGVVDDDSLGIMVKPEFVKKQPRREYSKHQETIQSTVTARARSTETESMRKSSLRKPTSERAGSLNTPRTKVFIGKRFLVPPKAKLLRPLPLIQPKRSKLPTLIPDPRSKSLKLKRYHKMLESALRAKVGRTGSCFRPPTPKPWNSRKTDDSYREEGKFALRKQFQASFPITERRIPEYDSLKDKHAKSTRMHVRRIMWKQGQEMIIQPVSSIPSPKRTTVRFQEDLNHIEPMPRLKDKTDLLLPKILPQSNDRPSSAPNSQQLLTQRQSMKRDQHSVPRSTRVEEEHLERDWGRSVLDSLVTSGMEQFNAEEDPSYLNEEEIRGVINGANRKTYSITELRHLIGKGQATLSKLHQEMMLPTHLMQAPPLTKEGLQALFQQCKTQLELRQLVLSILSEIHKREDLLLSLMTLGEDAGADFSSMYREVMQMSKGILAKITHWKELEAGKFVYMDSDYAEKIHEDSSNLTNAFKHLIGGPRDYLNSAITPEDLKSRAQE